MPQPAGAVIIVSSHGSTSGTIRLATRNHATHAGWADGQGNIYEALGGGIVKHPEDKYDHVWHVWIHAPIPDVQTANAWAVKQEHVKYNWPAIGVLGLDSIGIHCGPLARWADRRHAYICSEYVALAWRHGGLDPWPAANGYLPCMVSPGMILDRALAEGWA